MGGGVKPKGLRKKGTPTPIYLAPLGRYRFYRVSLAVGASPAGDRIWLKDEGYDLQDIAILELGTIRIFLLRSYL